MLEVFVLRGERFEPRESSELMSGLDLSLIVSFVGVRPMTRAVREYRAALRARA